MRRPTALIASLCLLAPLAAAKTPSDPAAQYHGMVQRVSKDNVKAMAAQIKKVYGKGDYVGSLVVPTGADRKRPTNWDGVRTAIDYSWRDFPGLVERFTLLGVPQKRTTIGIK